MTNFDVTQTTDNGNGDTLGTLSYAIQQANVTAGNDTITLNSNVRLTGVMKSSISSNINIVGNGKTISGDTNDSSTVDTGDVRPLFILSGTVNIDNLIITNGLAQGGDGGIGGGSGGAGAGMGGALFIYDGNVTLSNVTLNNNQARGGSGGNITGSSGIVGGGGGGGLNNSQGNQGGIGMGGYDPNFGNGSNGDFGIGGGGGDFGVGIIGGGGGGNGGFGGGGGGGGNAGFSNSGTPGIGGVGGYGGYGGGGGGIGQGFGNYSFNNSFVAKGGFGGGNGLSARGGGGAGMGGGIFVRSGALTLTNTSFTNNIATGGIGGNNGQGFGGALFIMKSTSNTNGNNQGLPTTLPIVTTLGNSTFMGNTATNNDNVFGTIITVLNTAPVNTLPAAQVVNEDTQLAITGISINDVDGNLVTIKLTVGSGVLNVTLEGATISTGRNNSSTITLAGTQSQINATLLRYQSNLNFNGTDNLTVVSTDSAGLTDTDVVNITVTAVNDVPIGSPTATLSNTAEDTTITITAASLLAGFSDVDGDTLLIANLAVNNGSLVNNSNGTYTFSPNANFTGTVTLTYDVTDGTATLAGQTRSFTVTPVNDAPIGTPIAILPNVAEDTAITITAANLLAGFSDTDGNLLSITDLVANNGNLVNNNNGTYTFSPNANFNGVVTLIYGVTDGIATLAGQTRSFTVNPVNDAPTGSPTTILSSTAEDTAIIITAANLLAGFSDPDGDALAVNNLVATNGSLVNNNGTYSFNPNANFNGVVNLIYGVTDGTTTLAGKTNNFIVTPVNDAPILQQPITDQQASQNQPFTFTIPSSSFIDVDAGDTLTYSVTQENGSPLPNWLVFNPITRIFTGTPTQANAGILTLKVTAADNAGAKASDVFTVNVGGGDIIGTEQADTLIGTNGNDNIIGLGGNDMIDGKEGNDTINGGAGNDSLNGAEGNDTFLIFGVYEGNDTYNGGTGNDTIKAQVNGAFIRLAGNFGAINSIEEITADGRTNITVAGDDGDNNLNFTTTILTNVAVNGGTGNDVIIGNAQANTIIGGAGNDSLNGAEGDDTFLVFGAYEGNDTYNGGTGNDTIKAQVNGAFIRLAGNFDLSKSIEIITANGKTGIAIVGDDGNNYLDFSYTTLTNVIVDGGSGNDTIIGSIQANTIRGGAGNDLITGGAGVDTFVLNKTSVDTITDFIYGEKLQISATEFGGLTVGSLATTQLLVGAGATTATTAAQRFIFNTTDKSLYFDSDGLNGAAAVKTGVLAGLPTLNSSNFSIVA